EQEAFHSKLYDFNIPNNINDFNKSNKQNSSNKSSKIDTIFRDSNKKLSKLFKKLQINSNDDEKEITQQQIKRQSINVDDEDEVYNNLNLHSKEQDELEIPDVNRLWCRLAIPLLWENPFLIPKQNYNFIGIYLRNLNGDLKAKLNE
ncbi:hypothetical protein RhiirB3_449373, partial [Rhizophagus irregularis]